MNEGRQWSAMGIITTAAWIATAALIVATWGALWFGNDPLSQAFGFTGCALSAVAAAFQIRRYACRCMALIRALHSAEEIAAAEFRGSVSADGMRLHTVP